VLKGNAWGRLDDEIGVEGLVEGLSPIARVYSLPADWGF
jgi:hypothetical protein